MKKNILMIAVLSLSVASVASASTEQFSVRLGEQKLSEMASGSFKCELSRGLVEKDKFVAKSISAPVGSSKAGSAR